MRKKRKKTQPQKVSFEHNDLDFTVAALCSLGYSTTCIANATGFTEGQVNYRIYSAGLHWSRYNFRNGTSVQAQFALHDFLEQDTTAKENLVNIVAEDLDHVTTKGKKIKPKKGRLF